MSDENTAVRNWLERHTGKVFFALIPILIAALAGWVLKIEGELVQIASTAKENSAQWRALYENRERVTDLKAEVEAYKILFNLLVESKRIRTSTYSSPRSNRETLVSEDSHSPKEPVDLPEQGIDFNIQEFRQQQMKK